MVYLADYYTNDVTVLDGFAPRVVETLTGNHADSVVVNWATNHIYAASKAGGYVVAIDGTTYSSSVISVGQQPIAMDVNPITNKIYVANYMSSGVSIIDGVSNEVTNIATGLYPSSLEVNPVTNKIYVVNSGSNSVTIIDGSTNLTETVPVGAIPFKLAINQATSKIYVTNEGANYVSVIDGTTDMLTGYIATPLGPALIAVDSLTNKIYITDVTDTNLTVVDGITGSASNVPLPAKAASLVVNESTDKIYVSGQNGILAINGSDNSTQSILPEYAVGPLTVDSAHNKIYAGYQTIFGLAVIDGISNSSRYLFTGSVPSALTFNPISSMAVSANQDNTLSLIEGAPLQPLPLNTEIFPLSGDQTLLLSPTFQFQVQGSGASSSDTVYFQIDTLEDTWSAATDQNSETGQTAALRPGLHTLYAYATDGQQAASTQAGSPLTGTVQAYSFLVGMPTLTFPPIATQVTGTSLALSASSSVGAAVTFASSTPAVCTVSGAVVQFVYFGACTLTVSQDSGGIYQAAVPVTQSFGVEPRLIRPIHLPTR